MDIVKKKFKKYFKMYMMREFPGNPVIRTPCFHCPRAQVQSLVGELKSHMPHGVAKQSKVYAVKSTSLSNN